MTTTTKAVTKTMKITATTVMKTIVTRTTTTIRIISATVTKKNIIIIPSKLKTTINMNIRQE